MAKIKHSLKDVSTDFVVYPADVYLFEIAKVEEVEKNGQLTAYRVANKILEAGDTQYVGKIYSDFINILTTDGNLNEVGLANLKRYFEVIFGKEVVKEWSDDDYDTDLLQGYQWRGQLSVESYTPKGATEPKPTNRIKHMEKA